MTMWKISKLKAKVCWDSPGLAVMPVWLGRGIWGQGQKHNLETCWRTTLRTWPSVLSVGSTWWFLHRKWWRLPHMWKSSWPAMCEGKTTELRWSGKPCLRGQLEGVKDGGPQVSSHSLLFIWKSLWLGSSWPSDLPPHSLTSVGADSEISVLVSLPNSVAKYSDSSHWWEKGVILVHETSLRSTVEGKPRDRKPQPHSVKREHECTRV